ncbi:hypothetical protein ABZ622_41145 [Streptomyces sp. NPDC007164]|uniref:hypothetical protein n=1 Tax=Streptomyces sp. NPDC007164 TaxID=3156918 RepID=UPI0033DCFB64
MSSSTAPRPCGTPLPRSRPARPGAASPRRTSRQARYAAPAWRPWAFSASLTRTKPPLQSYHCTYNRAWISVKATYRLTANPAEAAALAELLDTCDA